MKATVGDFISGCFQLIFTLVKNRLLPQSFNHIFYKHEQSFSLILYAARHIFPHSTSLLPSFLPLILPPKALDGSDFYPFSVLEAFGKNKEMSKYTLSREIPRIPEM